jgi:hypothetical protein
MRKVQHEWTVAWDLKLDQVMVERGIEEFLVVTVSHSGFCNELVITNLLLFPIVFIAPVLDQLSHFVHFCTLRPVIRPEIALLEGISGKLELLLRKLN